MLGIIGAMEEEIISFKQRMQIDHVTKIKDYCFYFGKYNKIDVVLVKSKVGKVAAGIVTTLLINLYRVEAIINVGTCCAVTDKMRVYDILIGDRQGYHDVDLTPVGRPYGQMSSCPRLFKSNKVMLDKMVATMDKLKYSYSIGTILTGDKFVADKIEMDKLIRRYFRKDNVLAAEMESAAIAQVCYFFKVPYLVVRIISDVLGGEDQLKSFEQVAENASEDLSKILYNYCE